MCPETAYSSSSMRHQMEAILYPSGINQDASTTQIRLLLYTTACFKGLSVFDVMRGEVPVAGRSEQREANTERAGCISVGKETRKMRLGYVGEDFFDIIQ